MFFNERQQKLLNYPLDGSRVKTLDKGGRKYSYLSTFDIVNTLNLIFGFDGWETNVKKLEMINSTTNQNGNFVVTFSAIVRLKVWDTNHKHYIIREDNGISVSVSNSIGAAMETASKACISDGLKRAAKSYGNSMGNPLYDPEQRDVDYSNSRQLPENKQMQQPQQSYQQPAQLQQPQQYNQSPNNTNQHDFTQLTNLGLTVMQKAENLIVIGENAFENKETIKSHGFSWDGQNKTWYLPLQQVA